MSKLFLTTALISANIYAATDAEIMTFLKKAIGKNPNIVSLHISLIDKQPVKGMEGWQAYMLNIEGKFKSGDTERDVSQGLVYFVNGDIITKELIDVTKGINIVDAYAPVFSQVHYNAEHLISGNADAKHKVVLFSDPLCPFCRKLVPEAMEYMKKYPETFAVYYYHFPLPSLHPAAPTLCKAAIAAELQGRKNVLEKLYKVDIDPRENEDTKILEAFNKALNTNITLTDIRSPEVEKIFEGDLAVARTMMVNGTPTMFFDGEKDASKQLYKQVKVN